VRRVAADRGVPIGLLTDNIEELVSREDVDIVVELMGPVETVPQGDPGRARTRQVRCHGE